MAQNTIFYQGVAVGSVRCFLLSSFPFRVDGG